MNNPGPTEKIFITSKARMVAESKILLRDKLKNALIGWYSFCLIGLSIGDLTKTITLPNFGVLSLVISIGLFGLSLSSNSARNFERAAQFRRCYLDLDELYNSQKSTSRKMTEFAKIKSQHENHSNADYEDMLFEAFIQRKTLNNASSQIVITKAVIFKVIFRKGLIFFLVFLLFLAPFLLAFYAQRLSV